MLTFAHGFASGNSPARRARTETFDTLLVLLVLVLGLAGIAKAQPATTGGPGLAQRTGAESAR
jgi:hypothetical protein